ncbi:hypothetical protein [Thauera sp.]|uniref:hypothetical protein n=1 Tax=Thauera sp. TaxID=1905334 RepID=UPI0039E2E822
MTQTFAPPVPVFRPSVLPHHGRYVMTCMLSFCLLSAAGIADARTRGDDSGSPNGSIPIREGKPHDGLRDHIMTISHEVGGKAQPPRTLDTEELNAIRRDVRGAYPEQSSPSRNKKPH